jgi:hypothetical protein
MSKTTTNAARNSGSTKAELARQRFTQVQLRLAELLGNEKAEVADDLASLLDEERNLLREYGSQWEQPLRDKLPGLEHVFFSQGEPNHVVFDATQFPAAATLLPTVARSVRYLTLNLNNLQPKLATEIFAMPILASLEGLSLKGTWGTAGAKALAASPHLGNLHTLDLAYCGIGPAGVAAVLGSSRFPRVSELDLSGNPVGFDGAMAISALTRLSPTLRVLHLGDAELHDGAVAVLGNTPAFAGLAELWLNGNPISAQGLAELRAARVFKNTVIHADEENDTEDYD